MSEIRDRDIYSLIRKPSSKTKEQWCGYTFHVAFNTSLNLVSLAALHSSTAPDDPFVAATVTLLRRRACYPFIINDLHWVA